jgi:glycine/D-amino acid oxidase-like deaminating enzyme
MSAAGAGAERAPLPGDRDADVCIVGAGYTGLWTAYYLKRARPDLEIAVLESEFAGFGASGRNGGWLSAGFPAPRERLLADHGRQAVLDLQKAMLGSVDEVIDVCSRESIEAEVHKAGIVSAARTRAELRRIGSVLSEDRSSGFAEPGMYGLGPGELSERIRIAGGRGALFRPHAARVNPARLVRGLADCVERAGVKIYEGTSVTKVKPRLVHTDRGVVRAASALICVEGFAANLDGWQRERIPLNSAIVITEPLPETTWAEIGWEKSELLSDASHAGFYAQRTPDGRIAIGGRGVPYRYGSRIDGRGQTQRRTVKQLTAILHDAFPATANSTIEHAWCGVLGVARDWTPSVRYDLTTGIGSAGGYVGNGVATANLAGRTMCDLVLGRSSELTALPWVGHTSRLWEPEPLRYVGTNLVYGLYRMADWSERRGEPRTSRFAAMASWLAGK